MIGDTELFKKMEETQLKIKRDSKCLVHMPLPWLIDTSFAVVFAASLYF